MSQTVWTLMAPVTPSSATWELAISPVGRDQKVDNANCECIILTAREVRVRRPPEIRLTLCVNVLVRNVPATYGFLQRVISQPHTNACCQRQRRGLSDLCGLAVAPSDFVVSKDGHFRDAPYQRGGLFPQHLGVGAFAGGRKLDGSALPFDDIVRWLLAP